jgi:hypothetical protein
MRTSALQEINGSIMHERDQGSKRKKWSGRVFHARTRKPRRRGVAESGRTCRLHAAAPYPVGEGVQSFDNEARKAKRRLLSLRQRAKCSKSGEKALVRSGHEPWARTKRLPAPLRCAVASEAKRTRNSKFVEVNKCNTTSYGVKTRSAGATTRRPKRTGEVTRTPSRTASHLQPYRIPLQPWLVAF